MRFIIGFPIVFSTVGFVLAMLALFAGKQPGFMEEYNVIMLNTSGLGHNLIPTPASGGDNPTTTSGGGGVGGFFSNLASSATAAVGSLESDIASLGDDLIDKLADELGISEFYSLHVMDSCRGEFMPNATAPGAGYNVTNCTEPLKTGQMNISALLDHELSVGPIHLNLADLKWSKELQEELDKIPGLLLATAIFFIIGAGAAGLSTLTSAAGLLTYHKHPRTTSLLNVSTAILAALCLFVGDMVVTIGGGKATEAINKFGDDIGLVATRGSKFLAIVWTAFGLLFLAAVYWGYEVFAERRIRRGGLSRKRYEERYSLEK